MNILELKEREKYCRKLNLKIFDTPSWRKKCDAYVGKEDGREYNHMFSQHFFIELKELEEENWKEILDKKYAEFNVSMNEFIEEFLMYNTNTTMVNILSPLQYGINDNGNLVFSYTVAFDTK